MVEGVTPFGETEIYKKKREYGILCCGLQTKFAS